MLTEERANLGSFSRTNLGLFLIGTFLRYSCLGGRYHQQYEIVKQNDSKFISECFSCSTRAVRMMNTRVNNLNYILLARADARVTVNAKIPCCMLMLSARVTEMY